jgi:hypothetical protein
MQSRSARVWVSPERQLKITILDSRTWTSKIRPRTYLGHKACHVSHHGGVITKGPNQHDGLFHRYFVPYILPENIIDQTSKIKKERVVVSERAACWHLRRLERTTTTTLSRTVS